MNIDSMTYGELKAIAAIFNGATEQRMAEQHPFVGKYCLIRCYSAGVHAGTLVSVDGDKVILTNSRRLWSWTAVEGVALSGVAQFGVKAGKLDANNPEIYLTGVIEIIPCSAKAEASINGK